jgi:4-amino-4-deoxy-L-arabinose transferase-like glycosyltransferase
VLGKVTASVASLVAMPSLAIDSVCQSRQTKKVSAITSLPHDQRTARSIRTERWAIFLVGLLLRFGFVLWHKTYVQLPGRIYPFALEVSSIAAHLARGQGFSSPFLVDTGPTAWVAPIYPFAVSAVFKIFGVYSNKSALVILGLQCVMAAATGVAIYALGRRTLGERIGIWASWIWTVSPIFFRWPVSWIWDFAASGLLLTTALVLTLDVAEKGQRRLWLQLGALWGVTALTNPALLSVLPFSLIYGIFANDNGRATRVKNAAFSTILCVMIISPWAIRNMLVFGRPVFLRSNFWFEFHLGNYHYSNGMGYLGFHPGANPWQLRKYTELGEQGYIQSARKESLSFVRKYPREFIDLTLHRTLWFWDGTPLLYQGQEWWKPWKFWPLSLTAWLGMIFLLTRQPRGWLLYTACVVIYPLPYYFIYPIAKYRYAIEPEMLLLSVYLANVVYSEFASGGGLQRGRVRSTT